MSEERTLYLSDQLISADPQAIPPVRLRFIDFLLSLGLDDAEKEGWKLTFTEAVNNAIKHGSSSDRTKQVGVRWWAAHNVVWLEATDTGRGPPAHLAEDPKLPDDPLAESGRGLFIIASFADKVEHWRSAEGYTARISKRYDRLNDVMPQNAEMDAILEELSDCYESLSLYDRMAETLVEDESIDHFVASTFEIFMDSHDYDAINLEIRHPRLDRAYEPLTHLPAYLRFGSMFEDLWKSFESDSAITWNSESAALPFPQLGGYSTGACVPVLVNDRAIGLIAIAYHSREQTVRSNDLRNLRALADIIGVVLSRAVNQGERDERKRLATEIKIATQLQKQLLPVSKSSPDIPGYDIYFDSQSALEIAGDFVEVRETGSGEYIGCIIDVMGKGVSAAILAGIFRSQFLAFEERGGKLSTFLDYINKALVTQLGDATMFITAIVFRLNTDSHEFNIASAGHPPALIFEEDGGKREVMAKEPPLGLFADIQYAEQQIPLLPGERVVLVTDGLYEWSSSENGIFGWDQMVSWMEIHHSVPAEELWRKFRSIMRISRKQLMKEQEDDETILILSRNRT